MYVIRLIAIWNSEALKNLFLQLDKWFELKFDMHDKWAVYWMCEFLYAQLYHLVQKRNILNTVIRFLI